MYGRSLDIETVLPAPSEIDPQQRPSAEDLCTLLLPVKFGMNILDMV
jgi:hypothetical protein